ncbi:MAG: hypothetical protein ACXAC0_02925 [Candidatus Thorarchaeota archaeon]|jgi:hypothetical protein
MTDGSASRYSELVADNEDEEMESEEFELTGVSKESKRAKQAALAAIMAALSLASAPIASVIPRIPGWDIALFDPISFFWIIAFLVGGCFVGIVTVFAGTVGLFFFDPSGFGPLFKILATLPMIVIPWLMVRYTTEEKEGKRLAVPMFYLVAMFAGTILRLLIMIPTNLVMVPFLYGPIWPADFIITYTMVLNLSQSLWDALIPYLLVHKSQIFEKFGMW